MMNTRMKIAFYTILVLIIIQCIIYIFEINITSAGRRGYSVTIKESKRRGVFCNSFKADSPVSKFNLGFIYCEKGFKIPSIFYYETKTMDSLYVLTFEKSIKNKFIKKIIIINLNNRNQIKYQGFDDHVNKIRVSVMSDSCIRSFSAAIVTESDTNILNFTTANDK